MQLSRHSSLDSAMIYRSRLLGGCSRSIASSLGWRDRTFEFGVRPIGGQPYADEWGDVKRSRFRVPRSALEAVPSASGLVYRGMAWEEWQFIRRECRIQSTGTYNLDQVTNILWRCRYSRVLR